MDRANSKTSSIQHIICLLSLIIFLCYHTNATATYKNASQSNHADWQQWLQNLKTQALDQGIRAEVFDRAFRGIHQPDRKTLRLDRRQPEKRLTFLKYRTSRGDRYRINLGIREYKKRQNILNKIGNEFGVDPCVITALWGIESSYGRYMGNFPVIKSLATLAYDNRRGAFFRKELLTALHILNDGHVKLSHFKGEWAGGSGHPQFLPSSWKNFAVDYDKDGHKDIWRNLNDVFASIANYLAKNGWQYNQPWGIEVHIPITLQKKFIGLKVNKTVREWRKLGIYGDKINSVPQELEASIITPYGGPNYLVFKNFKVIMRYNNSIYYAGTVAYMADKICQRK